MTSTWKRRIGLAAPALALYWIALAVGTHLPPGGASIPFPWDKVIHASGYGLLAFFAVFVWRGRTLPRLIGYVVLWCSLAGYGALDEITQPYFKRQCDIYDWIADVCGVCIGLLIHAAWAGTAAQRDVRSSTETST